MHGAGGAHGDATEDTRKRWSFKPAPRKEVPDFDALHEAFFRRLKEAKKNRPATVVQEFKLTEKDDAQRRRELGRIEADRLEDEKRLPEVRWPFASLRAKVNSTPPPVRDAGDARTLAKNENLATKLRRQAVLRAKSAGRYMSKAEREAREEEERARENRRRAAAWAEAQSARGGPTRARWRPAQDGEAQTAGGACQGDGGEGAAGEQRVHVRRGRRVRESGRERCTGGRCASSRGPGALIHSHALSREQAPAGVAAEGILVLGFDDSGAGKHRHAPRNYC